MNFDDLEKRFDSYSNTIKKLGYDYIINLLSTKDKTWYNRLKEILTVIADDIIEWHKIQTDQDIFFRIDEENHIGKLIILFDDSSEEEMLEVFYEEYNELQIYFHLIYNYL